MKNLFKVAFMLFLAIAPMAFFTNCSPETIKNEELQATGHDETGDPDPDDPEEQTGG